jgi:hypothetical protein
MTGLRAITVCVGYEDLLEVTLPYNRHHFSEVHVVTDKKSAGKVAELVKLTDMDNGNYVWPTDLFYADGAVFNKWRALEWGLDQMGRHGWICNMDADVLWPKDVRVMENIEGGLIVSHEIESAIVVKRGQLMAPLRRMCPWPILMGLGIDYSSEAAWNQFPIHRNVKEWAGYSQVFHADDPHLGPVPWHQIDWTHAGGADTIFQRKWPKEAKVRPAWQVLHLGTAGQNWFGRATPMADGTIPEEAEMRLARVAEIWQRRRAIRAAGGTEAESFQPERVRPNS